MSVYVFTGPTLSAAQVREELDCVCLPPAAQGDVYRVALRQPRAVGIIDGYFERLPAIWHKEILWAMHQGVHVFGSASMGALRAAELELFGMVGVGEVFEGYRSGALEDDDEVAVSHGAAEDGYVAVSEAMVNMRATFAAGVAAGVIGPATGEALVGLAKAAFYGDRSYPSVLGAARSAGLPAAEIDALHVWLPRGRVARKRDDALAMLRAMRAFLAEDPPAKRVRYTFARTDAWERLKLQAGALTVDARAGAEMLLLDTLVDELRLDPAAHRRAVLGALARLLAIDESLRQGLAATPEGLQAVTDEFRRERGLLDPADVERWCAEHHLDAEQFARLMHDELRWRWVQGRVRALALDLVPDHLRTTAEYAPLLRRARAKQELLRARGMEDAGLADTGLTQEALMRWYFEERLGLPVADDLARYAEELGYTQLEAFVEAVAREYLWLRARRGHEAR